MRICLTRDLGRMSYSEAFRIQHEVEAERKASLGSDTLLFVEHPHVVTIGRNGKDTNLLASEEILRRTGIDLFHSDRGGDVTYHGPGQVVGYPIMDLREWKRDVGAFVRGIEQVIINALADFGIHACRVPQLTGVWVGEGMAAAKIAAIGVHLSRWVSTHGWALNHTTDLKYFQYIVPCGLNRPVTSMAALGAQVSAEDVKRSLAKRFGEIFDFEMRAWEPALTGELR